MPPGARSFFHALQGPRQHLGVLIEADDVLHHIDVINSDDVNVVDTFLLVLVIVLDVLRNLGAARRRKCAWDAKLQIMNTGVKVQLAKI